MVGQNLPNVSEIGGKHQLELLRGISGAFRPGILTCLMGVSGAGTAAVHTRNVHEPSQTLPVACRLELPRRLVWQNLPVSLQIACRQHGLHLQVSQQVKTT